MAYNQRALSPRPSLAQLRAPLRQDSNPPSPVVASPSASTFAFPPPLASTSNGGYQYPQPLTSANSFSSNLSTSTTASSINGTARFHEALASLPTSRHRPTESTSSEASFRFPPDSASPSGEKAFDALQREFGPAGGVVGLGFEEDDEPSPSSRNPSPRFGRSFDESGKIYEEPESVGGLDGMAERTVRRGKERADQFGGAEETAGEMPNQGGRLDRSTGSVGLAGIGRPASMDMGGGEGTGEADTSFDFLLSPPAFDATSSSAKQFAAAAGDVPKLKGRDRTFPAPLLLKSDRNRPFAAPASPVLGVTAPLVITRKMSASSASSGEPSTSSAPPPSTSQAPSRWAGPSSSMPPPAIENHRSNLPYQQHRSKTSSTSSFTHGTSPLAYSHSSQHSGSSAMTMASPVITNGGTFAAPPPLSTITPPSSTATTEPPAAPEPPITPQALLLHVRLLRSPSQPMALSQSQGPLSRLNATGAFAQPVSHQRIRSAGSTASDNDAESPTRGPTLGKLETVDLSHKRIAEVPIEVVHELQDEVEKLALGYNLLRDLPPHFVALGGKLRYLNVRVNVLTTFPQVLCEMPSLEILDISRNKIKRLPTTPGSLVNLKVFSIAKNRVKRLPTWLAHMSHLKVLKIDHNPLEWPPKEITTFPANGSLGGGPGASISKVEEAEEMQRWLPTLQSWVRDNAMKENGRERAREEPQFDRRRRPSVMSQTTDDERSSSTHHEERSIDSSNTPRPGGMTRTESGRVKISPSTPSSATFPRTRVTPPSTSQGPSPSVVSADTLEEDPSVRHSRNASHSTTQSLHPEARPGLRSKKSLPDLRQSHADILAERRTGAVPEEEKTPRPAAGGALRRLNHERPLGMVHSNSARAALPTQATIATAPPTTSSTPVPPPTSLIPRSQSARPLPSATVKPSTARAIAAGLNTTIAKVNFDGAKTKRAQVDNNAPGFDRNSGAYFRRLSMLPTSTISKTVPVTLLEFADAIRGILFSLSQIYSALRQFVVFASQDRLPAPIARLMGTADGTMSDLINALDRFDSLSRRGTPSPNIVRDIFIACRESVTTFKQLVAALGPQLKSLIATADVRYTRTLLLMLYGSMGEIANSWNAVSPLLAEITSISDDPSLATLILQPPTPSPTLSSSSSSRPKNGGPGTLYRARSKTRRHAGSFSVEDVQLGAVLPPAPVPDMPDFSSENPLNPGTAPHIQLSSSTSSLQDDSSNGGGTIKARPTKANRGPGAITLPPSMGYRDMVMKAFEQPMTPGAGELNFSEPDGGTTSNGAGAGAASGGLGYPPATGTVTPSGSFSLPPSEGRGRPVSTANADATFVDMAESTITIARSIYAMLLDSFDADYDGDDDGSGVLMRELGPRRVKELTDLCILGNETTTKLRGALGRVRAPDSRGPLKFSPADAKRLGDEAYAFVQTVIRFAKLVKAISLEHGFAPRIREGVGQLTIATRELAKSLHTATSFRPSVPSSSSSGGAPTPRP